MKKRSTLARGQFASIAIFASAGALADVQFRGLGFVPGGTSGTPWDISANGAVVVGQSWVSNHYEAYRWSAETGMVSLDSIESTAWATSADGSIVVGTPTVPGGGERAVRWPESGGFVNLPLLPGAETRMSRAQGISADGNVIVGSCVDLVNSEIVPTRWTEAGIEALDTRRADSFGASANGSVIIGSREGAAGWFEAFRWTASTGVVRLDPLPGGRLESYGTDVSDNGSVVVGGSSYDRDLGHLEAFRWTSGHGMVGLGFLAGNASSIAQAVTGDGLTIVGYSDGGPGVREPFIFTPAQGMRPLQAMLEIDHGLNLGGWTLRIAWGISADGTAIVGEGINPAGQTETWLVSGLPPRCAADLNNDRVVDLADLATLLSSFGCVSEPCPDLSGDGETALEDLALLLALFGTDCP